MKSTASKVPGMRPLLFIIAITLAGVFLILLGCGEHEKAGFNSREFGSIKLGWDASTDPDVAGYKVYYGISPGKYGPGVAVGNVTTYDLTRLIKDRNTTLRLPPMTKPARRADSQLKSSESQNKKPRVVMQ